MVAASEQRRLLAILVADIVGYSNLMARFESETFQRVKELQSSLMMPTVERNKGEIVKYTGDGLIATFASALDAVRAAVEIQSGAKAASATAAEDRRIMFRIGINAGDVIVVPGDIYGDSVNIAARLQAMAKPGGICVSRSVRDTVKGKFEIDFTDLGDMDVKNIPDPVGTYELKYQAIAWTMERKGAEPISAPALRRWRAPLLAGSLAAATVAGAGASWLLTRSPTTPAPTAAAALPAPAATPPAAAPPVAAAPVASPPTASPPAAPSRVASPPAPPEPAPPAAAPSFERLLDERLARMAPDMADGVRQFHRTAYLQMTQTSANRAIAVAPALNAAWRMPSNASAANAEERALEGCQLRHGQPCAIAAVNDRLAPIDRAPWPLRDMPRLGYSGPFDPANIPAVAIPVRSRPDVAGYRTTPGFKAVAIHPQGYLHVATGADSQFAAEQRALSACSADPAHEGRNLPCFLYAVGDQVVLPRRMTVPVTATPPPAPPAAAVGQPANVAQQISARIAARAPKLEDAKRAELVDAYLLERTNRAMAVAPNRSGTWRTGGHATAAAAEERTLEGCMINYGEPCVVVAVNSEAPQSTLSPSQRVLYSGLFEPGRIPAGESVRSRQDTLSYRSAVGPKAAALHPWGLLHIVTGAASQREAEEKALAACAADPAHRNQNLPCYLYAVGDQVVLPRRAARALTP